MTETISTKLVLKTTEEEFARITSACKEVLTKMKDKADSINDQLTSQRNAALRAFKDEREVTERLQKELAEAQSNTTKTGSHEADLMTMFLHIAPKALADVSPDLVESLDFVMSKYNN